MFVGRGQLGNKGSQPQAKRAMQLLNSSTVAGTLQGSGLWPKEKQVMHKCVRRGGMS